MAKTPKPKPTTKPSPHSRSSRRATSPALEGNLDKSLRNLPRPSPPTRSNPILAPQPGTGISKKKHGGKVLKRKQRVRVEQGREKAEIRRGKLERKVERSERRGRNTDWDEVNEKATGKKRRKKGERVNGGVGADGWVDEDMGLRDVMNGEGKTVDAVLPTNVGAGVGTAVDGGDAAAAATNIVDEIT